MVGTMETGKRVQDSYTEMTELLLPQHANAIGTAFGGTILSWIDICAAIAAQRHCGTIAVTAAIDEMQFLAPICVGDVVRLRGWINAAFGTSMEVQVEVLRERASESSLTPCANAILVFVNRDSSGRPVKVPLLHAVTPEEKSREIAAKERKRARLERARNPVCPVG